MTTHVVVYSPETNEQSITVEVIDTQTGAVITSSLLEIGRMIELVVDSTQTLKISETVKEG